MTNHRLGRLRSRLRSSAAYTLPLSAAATSSRSVGKNGRRDKQQQHCLSPFLPSGKSIFLTVGTLALFTFGMIDNYETTAGKKSSSITSSPVIQKHKYDAVIVGAGWAGIKAAQTLIENGVENILVLEAHNYIGGR